MCCLKESRENEIVKFIGVSDLDFTDMVEEIERDDYWSFRQFVAALAKECTNCFLAKLLSEISPKAPDDIVINMFWGFANTTRHCLYSFLQRECLNTDEANKIFSECLISSLLDTLFDIKWDEIETPEDYLYAKTIQKWLMQAIHMVEHDFPEIWEEEKQRIKEEEKKSNMPDEFFEWVGNDDNCPVCGADNNFIKQKKRRKFCMKCETEIPYEEDETYC